MGTYHLRRLCCLELFRAIDSRQLDRLLEPYADYLARHGIGLPIAGREAPMKYMALVQLFIAPASDTPRALIDALYFVDELSTPLGVEILESTARTAGKALPWQTNLTHAEIALQYWLADPELVRGVHARLATNRFRSFEYFQSQGEETPKLKSPLDATVGCLQTELNDRFEARARGRYARVYLDRQAESVWFYIAHGGPLRREGTVDDAGPSSVCYRPEVYDAVVFIGPSGELGVYGRSQWERELYRAVFGKHLFGDESFFTKAAKYTLDPLWRHGSRALHCLDVPGMEWIKLTNLAVFRPAHQPRFESFRSEDLLASWEHTQPPFGRDTHILSAGFRIKLLGCRTPRRVTIHRGNRAQYTRDADRGVVEHWLKLRGFLLDQGDSTDAGLASILAVA